MMLDALLAQWTAVYHRMVNSTGSTGNSTSSQTHVVDIQSLPSTSTAAASATTGWTVTHVDGGDGAGDFAKSLQDILNRTETLSILKDVLYRPIIAAIVLASTFALWRKIRSPAGTSTASWRDAFALTLIGSLIFKKWMLEAIALTAAYVAWSWLADRPWNASSKTPDFDTFLASLRLATVPTDIDATTKSPPSTDDNTSATPSDATTTPPTSTSLPPPTDPSPEAAKLSQFEAQLGIPERKPEEECVVCWTSDETPLRLPCSHLVCTDCLTRLRNTNRHTCPYCSTALFSLRNTKKILLYQAAVASCAAHLAICLVEAALKIAAREYIGAAILLCSNLPSPLLALYNQSKIGVLGEEGFFAVVTEGSLGLQIGVSLCMGHAGWKRVPNADWATFFDGRWQRYEADEWAVVRGMVCWVAPGLAARVVDCPDI